MLVVDNKIAIHSLNLNYLKAFIDPETPMNWIPRDEPTDWL